MAEARLGLGMSSLLGHPCDPLMLLTHLFGTTELHKAQCENHGAGNFYILS